MFFKMDDLDKLYTLTNGIYSKSFFTSSISIKVLYLYKNLCCDIDSRFLSTCGVYISTA